VSYERLPGRGRHIAGMDYLWLADDHLLLARQRAYSETYQRFFFNDIQTLILRRTRGRAVSTAVVAGLSLLCAGLAWITDWPPGKITWFVLLGLLLLIGIVNWFRGPTTRCHLTTRLHSVPLRSLGREKTARRVLARLKEKIEEVQGAIASVADEPPPVSAVRPRCPRSTTVSGTSCSSSHCWWTAPPRRGNWRARRLWLTVSASPSSSSSSVWRSPPLSASARCESAVGCDS